MRSLEALNWRDHLFFRTELPEGVPTHTEKPYAFKYYAINELRKAGHKNVLWVDSSIWAQHNPEPIFKLIQTDGYFLLNGGWSNGQWSSDKQLQAFNYTREEAFLIKHCIGGFFGLNFATETGNKILDEMMENIDLFPGAWDNKKKEISQDERVLGTRHDQTVLSFIAHKNKLTLHDCRGEIDYLDYNVSNSKSIMLAQGM